jgi:HPt (histidine-containing phosphotransfer) domain-containing protein
VLEAPVDELELAVPDVLAVVEAPVVAEEVDEQVKVIGHLRLGIPLYNVYLNEADEWSRRLQVELSDMGHGVAKAASRFSVSLAHSLLGSSATVGFTALSEMARALEQALQHVQLHLQGTPEQADVFSRAAEDIRRLLHQFAAGFLKESDADVLAALQTIIETEFPAATIDSVADTLDDDLTLHDLELPEVHAVEEAAPVEAAVEVPAAVEPVNVPAPALCRWSRRRSILRKSTVTRMAKIIEPYINADDIKTSIRCDDLTAAKLATSMREKQLNDRKGFTFETVLSTTRNLKLLKKAKQQGFFIIGRVIIFKIKACYLG